MKPLILALLFSVAAFAQSDSAKPETKLIIQPTAEEQLALADAQLAASDAMTKLLQSTEAVLYHHAAVERDGVIARLSAKYGCKIDPVSRKCPEKPDAK